MNQKKINSVLRLLVMAFYLCFSVSITQAQLRADSLKSVIKSAAPYEKKIKAYLELEAIAALKNFDEALRIGNEGLALAEKKHDAVSSGELKRRIGEGAYFKGNYDKAAQYFYESIATFEKAGVRKSGLAWSYNAMARLYRKTKDLKRALNNYDKAMIIFRELADSTGIASIYNESGVVYEYAGEYAKAAEYYDASLQIHELRKDTVGICYALSNLGSLYALEQKYGEAEKYLMKNYGLRRALNDSFAIALSFADLGNLYLSSGKANNAKLYLDSSNAIAKKMHYPELQSTNYDMLAKVAEKENDFKKALEYYQLKSALKDSLFGIDKANKIEELNTLYETEKKERQINDQLNKIGRQNIFIASGIILVILGTLLGYTQYRRYKWRQEAKMQADILIEREFASDAVIKAEETERKRIANDLHDGVGQLMSAAKMNLSAFEHRIKFHSEEEKVSFEKIISLVDAGCKEVRAVSHNMMPNALLQNDITGALQEFINKLDRSVLSVHLHSEGFTEPLNSNIQTVLYRIIQECVNNVIKHSGADTLDISLIKEQELLSVSIEDNGKGFDINHKKITDGMGMKNIHTRIKYLKGTVEFSSKPGKGTLVALYIPV